MALNRKNFAKYNMAGPSQCKNSEISTPVEESCSSDTPVLQYYKVFSDVPASSLQNDVDEINEETRIFFNIKDSTSILFAKTSKSSVLPPAPPPTPSCSQILCDENDDQSEFSSDDEGDKPKLPEDDSKHTPSRGYLFDKAATFTGIITRKKSKTVKEKEIVYTGIIKPKKKNIVNKCVNNVMNKFRMRRED